jgi:hypothetical protein
MRHSYGGVRERLFYPRWRYLRTLKRVLPDGLGRKLVGEGPPFLRKMPLVRSVPSLRFEVIHTIKGATLASEVTALLHYKLDVDFDAKVTAALAERPYPAMAEYEAYGQLNGARSFVVKSERSVRFTGPEDLEASQLLIASPGLEKRLLESGGHSVGLETAEREIARFGHFGDAERLWAARWGAVPMAQSA